jgi:nitrate reductase gamma subunit
MAGGEADTMTSWLYGAILLGAAIFLVASTARAVRFAKMPLHLRWELYPVPGEGKRAKHGGSYFETSEWWTKRRRPSLLTEGRYMAAEILGLKALREFNRGLWWRSYPFHAGLYLLGATCGLILAATLAGLVVPALVQGRILAAAHGLYSTTGLVGAILTLAGAAGLLHRRLTDPALRPYTTAGDLANLVFFLAATAVTAVGYAVRPAGSAGPAAILRGLLAWDLGLRVSGLFGAGLIASAILVAYIPLTHMSHFVAKFFTYHQVRWDDAPSQARPSMQARMAEYLTYRPTWAAPHILGDGMKSWKGLVSTNPMQGPRK